MKSENLKDIFGKKRSARENPIGWEK